ncbi:MAG: hypothetical protein K5829_05190 [Treponema sp.]|nr:hypothetical protein [Treponema sp.]
MKKSLFAILLFFFIPGLLLFSQTMTDQELDSKIEEVLGNTDTIKDKINFFVSNNFFSNMDAISELSFLLPVEDRTALLEKNFMKSKEFLFLNLWPGFGVGSYRQKDYSSFSIFCTLDILATASIAVGTAWFVIDLVIIPFVALSGQDSSDLFIPPLIFFCSGFGVALISRTVAAILASNYSKKFNSALQKALLLDSRNVLSLSPLINPVRKEYGLMAALRL